MYKTDIEIDAGTATKCIWLLCFLGSFQILFIFV